jgi:glucose-6-phosphate-specific signal transduction histidine kinase
MDYTFIICPNIIGLLALLILSIFTRFNFYLDKRKLKLFVAAAACNAVIIALEVADYYLGEALFANAYILRRITTAIGFMLTPIIPLLIGYIAEKKPFSKLVLIPAAANMVICALRYLTDVCFISTNIIHTSEELCLLS